LRALKFPKKSNHIYVYLLPNGKVNVGSIPEGIKVSVVDFTSDARKASKDIIEGAELVSDNPDYIGERLYYE
jgi:hypothetical protein